MDTLDERPTVDWRLHTDQHVLHPPVVSGEQAFVATVGGRLHTVEIAEGEISRSVDLPGAVTTAPVVDRDRVFVGCLNGSVMAFSGGGEAQTWETDIDAPVAGLAVTNDLLVAQVGSGGLCILDRDTGESQYRRGADIGSIEVSPSVTDDRVIGWLAPDVIVGLDPLTGEDLWAHHTARTENLATQQLLAGEQLLVPVGDGALDILNPVSGERMGTVALEGNASALATDGVNGFVVTETGEVFVVEETTKRRLLQLSTTTDGPESYSAAYSDQTLFVGTDTELCAADINGELRWQVSLGHGPVLPEPAGIHCLTTLIDAESLVRLTVTPQTGA